MDKILVQSLFDSIDNNLSKLIDEMKKEVTVETMNGNYELIGRTIKILQKIENIKVDLKTSKSEMIFIKKPSVSKRTVTKRLSKGKKMPQKEYYIPILKVIDALGGSAENKLVLEGVYKLMKYRLSEYDYAKLNTRDEPRWENTARWARKNMVDMGYLSKTSAYGIWEITDRGRDYLEKYS